MSEVNSILNSRNGNCREAIEQLVKKTREARYKILANSIDIMHTASSS